MSHKDSLDRIDLKILQALQEDAQIKNRDLADQVALSPSACLRRVRDLEERGLITGYRAHVAIDRIRAATIVIAQLSFDRHSVGRFMDFDTWAAHTPEIWSRCGSADTTTTCCGWWSAISTTGSASCGR